MTPQIDPSDPCKIIFDELPVAIIEEDLSVLLKLRRHLQDKTVTNPHNYLLEHPDLVKETFNAVKIISANQAALRFFDTPSRANLTENIYKSWSKDLFKVLVAKFSVLLEGKLFFEAEIKYKTLKGRSIDVRLKLVVPGRYHKTFRRVIVLLENVTEQRKTEQYLKKLAQLDSLTRLYNHTTIKEHLESEVLRSKRYGSTVSCMMIDVDHFKVINDLHGHQQGDVVIKQVAQTLKKNLRLVDVVGRYGGDEFLVILPETSPGNAKIAATRLQSTFAAKKFHIGKGAFVRIALSIGITGFPARGNKDTRDLLNKVDKAMYAA